MLPGLEQLLTEYTTTATRAKPEPEAVGAVPSPFGEVDQAARHGNRTGASALAGVEDNTVSATQSIRLNTDNPRLAIVATLLASGKSRKEIAAVMGISYNTVITLASQPVVKQKVKDLLAAAGGNQIKAFLSSQVMQSLETYVEIRDNIQNKPSDRKAAADALIDRALGKPTQHIETKSVDDIADATLELATLQNSLTEKTAQLRALGISSGN